ncbi:hypothetical protein DLAC_01928 [Tieghemostelium lacteum]|uniref:Uncharacterized protein n=1 Tax=Tieghemostelium lacteum TaxID=361077 RepID=A0A152A524_TIELA|nr:hypothetical protein DLAC_01928 [Tieghemostelium lacteum]|eukprot:KYR01338.1 hypothetical protein DLAC_01928 [Tieghemostelium lacteum]
MSRYILKLFNIKNGNEKNVIYNQENNVKQQLPHLIVRKIVQYYVEENISNEKTFYQKKLISQMASISKEWNQYVITHIKLPRFNIETTNDYRCVWVWQKRGYHFDGLPLILQHNQVNSKHIMDIRDKVTSVRGYCLSSFSSIDILSIFPRLEKIQMEMYNIAPSHCKSLEKIVLKRIQQLKKKITNSKVLDSDEKQNQLDQLDTIIENLYLYRYQEEGNENFNYVKELIISHRTGYTYLVLDTINACKYLQSLTLQSSNVSLYSDELGDALTKKSSLTHLELDSLPMTFPQLETLSNSLNPNLTSITLRSLMVYNDEFYFDLDEMEMSDINFLPIITRLFQYPNIKSINFSHHYYYTMEYKILEKLLLDNQTLENLYLDFVIFYTPPQLNPSISPHPISITSSQQSLPQINFDIPYIHNQFSQSQNNNNNNNINNSNNNDLYNIQISTSPSMNVNNHIKLEENSNNIEKDEKIDKVQFTISNSNLKSLNLSYQVGNSFRENWDLPKLENLTLTASSDIHIKLFSLRNSLRIVQLNSVASNKLSQQLSSLLVDTTCLYSLKLVGCNLMDQDIDILFTSIQLNRTVHELSLDKTKIPPQYLMEFFSSNHPTILSLKLARVATITDINVICQNQTIRSLNLTLVPLQQELSFSFLNSIVTSKNQSLIDLNYSENNILWQPSSVSKKRKLFKQFLNVLTKCNNTIALQNLHLSVNIKKKFFTCGTISITNSRFYPNL